jgi:hypothetical protein
MITEWKILAVQNVINYAVERVGKILLCILFLVL